MFASNSITDKKASILVTLAFEINPSLRFLLKQSGKDIHFDTAFPI